VAPPLHIVGYGDEDETDEVSACESLA